MAPDPFGRVARRNGWSNEDQRVFVEEDALNAFDSARRRLSLLGVGALLLGMTAILSTQGAVAHEGVSHPAHIHTGACPAPADVVFPLSEVNSDFLADNEPMAGDAVGSANAIGVDISVTTVQAPLADLVAADHAIVVHESAENIGNYVLCGDIGGPMFGESILTFGLGELNDSGASGIAILTDNGDGTTSVQLVVTMDEDDHDDADHEEDMSSDDAAGSEVAVSIENFSFGDTLEVKVGTTVTWTNVDSAPHTVTQTGGGGFQSGKIDSGGSFSFTFDEPGTFDYFCEYHANMTGTVIVTE